MATEFGTRPSLPGLRAAAPARSYEPRRPEETTLYAVVREQLETFLARARERDHPVPRFVEQELRAYLACGVLAHGFLRLHCDACQLERLVPFSCKRRGFCPSCGGRRMADTAAHLVDCVLPEVPMRQWVLTLPYPLRYRCAYDAQLTSQVLRAFLRALFAALRRRARDQWGTARAQCGAVSFIQRFGSALNLNLHFHTLALDGVYTRRKARRSTSCRSRPRARPRLRACWPARRAASRGCSSREPRATTTLSPGTSPCWPRSPSPRCAPASRRAPKPASAGDAWAIGSSRRTRRPTPRPPPAYRSTPA